MATQVTIKFGVDAVVKSYREPVTLGSIKSDSTVKLELGFGDNVKYVLDGEVLTDDYTPIPSGVLLEVETKCNEKA